MHNKVVYILLCTHHLQRYNGAIIDDGLSRQNFILRTPITASTMSFLHCPVITLSHMSLTTRQQCC